MSFLLIAAGGALGALLRYLISGAIYKLLNASLPWGTLAVNLIGSFAIGFLWELSERAMFSPQTKMLVFVGLIGAFTTFSTYSLESLYLFRDGKIQLAISNILISNVCGIALVFLGFIVSRYLASLF